MLIIRPEQIKKFEENELRYFEDRMVKHIKEMFPKDFERMLDPELGDYKVRELIQEGIKKAAGYKIKSEKETSSFIDLMVIVENDFDKREDMGWAVEILEDHLLSQDLKMELIHYKLPQEQAKRTP